MARSPNYPINVKIPLLYIEIIDENLRDRNLLHKSGFRSRSHFVREVIRQKLTQLDLLSDEAQRKLETQRRR